MRTEEAYLGAVLLAIGTAITISTVWSWWTHQSVATTDPAPISRNRVSRDVGGQRLKPGKGSAEPSVEDSGHGPEEDESTGGSSGRSKDSSDNSSDVILRGNFDWITAPRREDELDEILQEDRNQTTGPGGSESLGDKDDSGERDGVMESTGCGDWGCRKAEPCGRVHTVTSGQTLAEISRIYYGNPDQWRRILEMNRSTIEDPSALYPGMKLIIPGNHYDVRPDDSDSERGSSASRIYIVRKGDTLFGIARRHYGNGLQWHRILEANRDVLSKPAHLRPGMRLVLP